MSEENRIEVINEVTYIEIVEEKNIVTPEIKSDDASIIEVEENITTLEITEEVIDIVEVAIQGPPGIGIPVGGKSGESLVKSSDNDYDFIWEDTSLKIDMGDYDKNKDGKIDEAEVADVALNANLVGGRSITEFYDKTYVNTVTSRYIHNQSIPNTKWTISHNLNRYPSSVTIVDSAGSVVEGSIQHINDSMVIITFNYAFSGKAFID